MKVNWIAGRLPSKEEVGDYERCWVTMRDGTAKKNIVAFGGGRGVRYEYPGDVVAWAKHEYPGPYDPDVKPNYEWDDTWGVCAFGSVKQVVQLTGGTKARRTKIGRRLVEVMNEEGL